jgi:excisionase family DNA binding protein
MDLREAAEALGVHYQTAYAWARDGTLPARKAGRGGEETRAGFRVVAERAAAGLARALSRRPPGRSTRTPAAAPAPSDGAAQPAEGKP